MPAVFDGAFPLAQLKPASYNPRRILPDAEARLRESVKLLGTVKPVIITDDATIVAGHQRTKALIAVGELTVPVVKIGSVNIADEVTFNQLHNGVDLDAVVFVPPSGGVVGFVDVVPDDVRGELRQKFAAARVEVSRLLQKYGTWGAAVATAEGEVISSGQYALACKVVGMPARIYYLPASMNIDEARRYLGGNYGVYSYDAIQPKNWIATFAQPCRNVEWKPGIVTRNPSLLYEPMVWPELDRSDRLIDFGSGKGAYATWLQEQGYPVHQIEFFRRINGGEHAIDTTKVHAMIDDALASFRTLGPFDKVVCDAVINSVTSQQAEDDVLACCSAFGKTGAVVYFGGRLLHEIATAHERDQAKTAAATRNVEFLDENGLSAIYTKGEWFFQKYHTVEQVKAIALRWFGDDDPKFKKHGGLYKVRCILKKRAPLHILRAAFEREFNLDWPNGLRVNRHQLAMASLDYVAKRWNY